MISPLLPWFAAGAGPTLLFGPMLLRGEILFWGTPLLQFLPWHSFALSSLRAGHIPLWNPWLGMGAPLLANHQSAVLYLPNLLLAFVGPAWGHGLLVWLHLLWAGIGMIVLCRRLGIGLLGQALAAAAFPMCGYVVARVSFLSMNAALAWVPWVIWAGIRVVRSAGVGSSAGERRTAVAALAALVAFQWLAGHAQTAWYTLWIVWAWMGWEAIRRGGPALLRTMALGLVAMIIAAGLTAVQILPTFEYWRESQRATGVDPTTALTYSLWPWRLLGTLAPDLFGSPVRGDYWGYGNYWEDALYVGMIPILLAIASIGRGYRGRAAARPGLVRLQVGLAGLSVLFALGSHTPIYPWLFGHVPTFNAFQAPTRWSLILAFSLVILAAHVADMWTELKGRGLYWVRLGTAGAGAGLLVSLAAMQLPLPIEASIPSALAGACFWLLVAGILGLLRGKLQISQWAWAVVVVVSADLVAAGRGLNPSAPAGLVTTPTAIPGLAAGGHRLFMPADLEYEIKFLQTHRFDRFLPRSEWNVVRESGLPNTSTLDGVSSANNFDPLVSARFAEWAERLGDPAWSERWLPLMDVGWRAAPKEGGAPGAGYLEVPGASRARVVGSAVCVTTTAEAWALLEQPDFDPSRTVVVENCRMASGGSGTARVEPSPDPNSVAVTVDAPEGGWLVLSDSWYPGWNATVDGEPAQVFAADVVFRAVWLPAGARHVEFIYRPWSFGAGVWISFLSWLAWAGLWRARG
ncbi:MAG: YfhO family protein [Anaerolineales bacterium]